MLFRSGPEHTGLFEARADDGFTSRLDDSRTDKQSLGAELGVTHAFGIGLEVIGLGGQLLLQFWGAVG